MYLCKYTNINDHRPDIRNKNLNNMYKDQKEFNASSPEAKKVLRTLDYLNKIFKENTPELKPYYAVSFYLLISTLLDKYVITNMEDKIFEFFLEFENYRQKEKNKPEEKDPEIMEFEDKVSHSSDSKSSLEWRHDFFITENPKHQMTMQLVKDSLEEKLNNDLF